MLAPLLKTVRRDDEGPALRAPRSLAVAALPVVDEDFVAAVVTVVEDDAAPLVRTTARRLAALPSTADEVSLSFVITDDELSRSAAPKLQAVVPPAQSSDEAFSFVAVVIDDELSRSAAPKLRAVPPAQSSDEALSFVLADDELSRSAAPQLKLVALRLSDEEALSPVLIDDELSKAAAPKTRSTALPRSDEEALSPVLVDDEMSRSAAPPKLKLKLKLKLVPLPQNDEERSFVIDSDDALAARVPRTRSVSTASPADEESILPIEEDTSVRPVVSLRLVPPALRSAPAEEVVPTAEEDNFRALLVPRPLKIVPRHDVDDEFVGPAPPPPSRPFVGGGGGSTADAYDPRFDCEPGEVVTALLLDALVMAKTIETVCTITELKIETRAKVLSTTMTIEVNDSADR